MGNGSAANTSIIVFKITEKELHNFKKAYSKQGLKTTKPIFTLVMSGMIWFLHICGFSSSWGDIWWGGLSLWLLLLIVKIPSCQGVFDKHWRSASSRISPHCYVPHTSTRCRYQRDLIGMPTYLNTKTPQVKNSEELLSGWIFDDNSVTHSTLYPAAELEAGGEQLLLHSLSFAEEARSRLYFAFQMWGDLAVHHPATRWSSSSDALHVSLLLCLLFLFVDGLPLKECQYRDQASLNAVGDLKSDVFPLPGTVTFFENETNFMASNIFELNYRLSDTKYNLRTPVKLK